MIVDGKKLPDRALTLAAYKAARRFARGGPGHAAYKRNWAPLVLRWRKRRAVPPGMPAGGFVSSTNIASFPQFHFYLTQFFTQRGRSPVSSIPDMPLTIFHRQTIRNYKPVDLARARPPLSKAAGHRRPGAADRQIEERANMGAGMQTESRYSGQNYAAAAAPGFPRRESTLIHRSVAGRKKPPPKATRTRATRLLPTLPTFVFAGRPRSRSDRRPIPAAQVRAEMSNAVLSARKAASRPAQSYQGEELFWRRVTRSIEDEEERPHRQWSADQPVRAEPSPIEASQIAGDRSASAAAAAGRAMTSFDPAMVDRLTDDIIRRVEKRARIERERRGLG